MASCTRVENALQAFVDGELNDAERLIVEDHLGECAECARSLRAQRRTAALLFEAFSEHRLTSTVRPRVLEHLPEMEPLHSVMEDVNRRVKNPLTAGRLLAQYAPAFVLLLVGFLAIVIYRNWPEPVARAATIGAITYEHGDVRLMHADGTESSRVRNQDFVNRGGSYRTQRDAALALSLLGPTTVKVDEETELVLMSDRLLDLRRGRAWFNVGQTGNDFLIRTPAGDVRVLGTIFGVEVVGLSTTVTVLEGLVHVERGDQFAAIRDGFQLRVVSGEALGAPIPVDAHASLAWSEDIAPVETAVAYFERALQAGFRPNASLSESIFRLDLREAGKGQSLQAVKLAVDWRPDNRTGHCGYHVYVSDDNTQNSVFKHYIDGAFFNNPRKSRYDFPIPDGTLRGADVLHVRLVPDATSGDIEAAIRQVSAIGYAD